MQIPSIAATSKHKGLHQVEWVFSIGREREPFFVPHRGGGALDCLNDTVMWGDTFSTQSQGDDGLFGMRPTRWSALRSHVPSIDLGQYCARAERQTVDTRSYSPKWPSDNPIINDTKNYLKEKRRQRRQEKQHANCYNTDAGLQRQHKKNQSQAEAMQGTPTENKDDYTNLNQNSAATMENFFTTDNDRIKRTNDDSTLFPPHTKKIGFMKYRIKCAVDIARNPARQDPQRTYNAEPAYVNIFDRPVWVQREGKSRYGVFGPPFPLLKGARSLATSSQDVSKPHVYGSFDGYFRATRSAHKAPPGGLFARDNRFVVDEDARGALYPEYSCLERDTYSLTPNFDRYVSRRQQAKKDGDEASNEGKLSDKYRDAFLVPPPRPLTRAEKMRGKGQPAADLGGVGARSVSAMIGHADGTLARTRKSLMTFFGPGACSPLRQALLYTPDPFGYQSGEKESMYSCK